MKRKETCGKDNRGSMLFEGAAEKKELKVYKWKV